MNHPNVLIPQPTAWKPREQTGNAPVLMLPEPTAAKPRTAGAITVPTDEPNTLSRLAWGFLSGAGAIATYGTLMYFIYHNFRIGARLNTLDMWAKSLQGRIPSAEELINHAYPQAGEIAAVLFFGDNDYLGDPDDWDLGVDFTPTSRAYQAIDLVNTRLKDWGLSLDPIKEHDLPPTLQQPPVRILTYDEIANLYNKVSEYQAIERIREGDAWEDLLQF